MQNQESNSNRKGLKVGNFLFSPGILPTLATFLVLSILLNLGFWQLNRAAEKDYIQARLENRDKLGPIELEDLLKLDGDINDFPLEISGKFDNRYNLLLDNRIYKQQAGYHLLTLFYPSGTDYGLWVNRGWLSAGKDRAVFPVIEPIKGLQIIKGKVYTPSDKVFLLKEDDLSQASWPLRVQSVDLSALKTVLGVQLLPFTLRLNPDPNNTKMPREWHYLPVGPEKHRGYAFQWFTMSFALIMIYFITNTMKIKQDQE